MRINTILAGVLATAFICPPLYAQAQDIKLAPLNPEFETMLNNNRRGLKGPVLRTADGQGLGLLPSPLNFSHLAGRGSAGGQTSRAFPASYDLRTLGRLTSVKNQNPYSTCWAFAAYGSLESCRLLSPGETNDFSENNLANLSGFDYGFDGGGFSIMATAYLARWLGPVNESDDPYGNPGQSTTNPPAKHIQAVEVIGNRPSSLANDEIKQAVQDHGALCVGMYYAGGYYNSANHSYYFSGSAYANHAVAIVGWDDAYSSNNFSSHPAGDGAFIVKNSWGTGWGESGYFYASYYDTVFARDVTEASFLFLNAEAASIYSCIYQYDPLGWVNSLGFSPQPVTNICWGANVFTVTNGGDLSAVSFYATATNAGYEIFVYSDVSSGQPRSGSLRADQTGALTNAGYYAITLASPIALNAEELFSIVVKFTTPSYQYPLPVEYALAGYSSQAAAAPGQSFISSDGLTWNDATAYDSTMNVCIKAFMSATAWPYSAPADFSATKGAYSDKVRLTWSRVPGATGYSVYRGASSSVLSASELASTAALYYDDSAVTPGVVYYYWVKATGASGSSDYSVMDYGSARLSAPAGLSASQGTSADSVQLSWSAAIGAAGYIIYRNQVGNSNTASEIVRSSLTSYDDPAAVSGVLYYYWVKATNICGYSDFSSAASGWRTSLSSDVPADYDGDGKADPALYNEAAGTWKVKLSSANYVLVTITFGIGGPGYVPVPADYDGDGLADPAVYQESNGEWTILKSSLNYATWIFPQTLGGIGYSGMPADYDGDFKADPGVYLPAVPSAQPMQAGQRERGDWKVMFSSENYRATEKLGFLGGTGYRAVAADYDGDRKGDPAIYGESNGVWAFKLSGANYLTIILTPTLGGPGYIPVPADYDGDGLADPAVRSLTNDEWIVMFSTGDYIPVLLTIVFE